MKTIKIYGYGFVGKAMQTLFPNALIQDPDQGFISNKIGDFCPLNDKKIPRKGKQNFRYTIKIVLYFKKKSMNRRIP